MKTIFSVSHSVSHSETGLKLPTWLLILIVGLPLFSETAYSPALPDIALALSVSESWVEYTLTIYLVGFALGTFLWGNLSDKWGRKSTLLVGLAIYSIGCIGCYLSDSITALLIARFIQALGGSSGSVLGQAMSRDVYQGAALGKIYATVGASLALFPALGPLVGGSIDQEFGWRSIFVFLSGAGVIMFVLVWFLLPETHRQSARQPVSLMKTGQQLSQDPQVIGFCLLVAAANGLGFSYYAEAPFFMIDLLGITPQTYGVTFLALASATFIGGLINRWLHRHKGSLEILNLGLGIILGGALCFVSVVLLTNDTHMLLGGVLGSMMLIMGGTPLVTGNALSLALLSYKDCIGTASSLFGFAYYSLISGVTLGMGLIHQDGMTLPMPLYFLAISVFMIIVKWSMSQKAVLQKEG